MGFPVPRRRLLAAAVSAVALLCAAPATSSAAGEAGRIAPDVLFPFGGPSATTAWQVGQTHWGLAPCKGEVELSWTRLGDGVNATAYWYNPTDAWNNAAANYDCRIEFNVAMQFDWVKFCSVLAHEIGHLLGHQHDERDDLMASYYREPLPECEQTPDPGAPPPAPPAPEQPAAPVERDAASASAETRRPALRIRWASTKRYGKGRKATVARTLKRRRVAARRCVTFRKQSGRKVQQLRCHAGTLRRVARAARHTAR